MSDNQKTILAGAVGAVVGVAIGFVAAPSGPGIGQIEAVVAERIDALESARTADMEALMSGQTALTERLDAVAAQAEASSTSVSQMADEIGQRVAGMSDEIGNRVSGLGDTVSSKLEQATEAQTSALASVLSRFRGSDAEAPAAADTSDAGDQGEEEQADVAPVSGSRIGETASLAGDRIRVFVSRIDGEARRARLHINGQTTALAAGEQYDFDAAGVDCRLQVLGVGNGQVALDGNCGEALPEPAGFAPGTSTSLADGQLRVFVSAIDEEAGTARIAVNGTSTQRASVGETIDVATEAGACSVTVTGIDRGHVNLDGACGS